jgi:two-component system, cell cycle response regulator
MTEDLDARFMAAWHLRIKQPVDALDVALQLAEEVADHPDAGIRGRVALLEGSCRWRMGDYPAALRTLLGAFELFDDDHRRERAAVLADLGIVRDYFGEHDLAMELTLDALRIREAIGDEPGQGDAYNNIGIIAYHRGDLDGAEQAYRSAATIRLGLGDRDGVAAVSNNLGKVLTSQGAHDAALVELERAERAWTELGNTRGLGMVHNNIGIVLLDRGEIEAATARFVTSLALKAQVGDRHGACETTIHLARIASRQGEHERARALLDDALAVATELGIRQEIVAACEAMAEVHEADGDLRLALDWYRRFHREQRQLFDERSAERLRALQIAHRLERAEREGSTDGLTGLANRRAFDRRLAEELERARRDGSSVALALLDLDSFKVVNDTFGHTVGDEVLRRVATLLRDHTRTADLAARYGGEEFALLLPGTELNDAVTAAEQVRKRIGAHPWSDVHPELVITVSIGVAAASAGERLDAPQLDGAELLERADRHLYHAKHAGKDRVKA